MKERLDNYLVKNNYIDSRSRAKQFIQGEREVYVNDKLITKPAFMVDETDRVVVKQKHDVEYVSRAGYKLDKAVKYWHLDLSNKRCLDIGASTGGFTECCLDNGASQVVSVDVGHDQLHPSLRENEKVINLEGFNFKEANVDNLPYEFDFYCCDVSFISLKHILFPLGKLNLSENSFGVMLIKPQFESERNEIKGGTAMHKSLHYKAIKKSIDNAIDAGFYVDDITGSPIRGNKKGNIEYLMLISRSKLPNAKDINDSYINKVISHTWKEEVTNK